MQVIKIILIISSTIGYYLYLKRKNIREEFIPIIIVSSISLVIYIAGILNFLAKTAILIGIIGIVLLAKEIYSIIKNKEKIKVNYHFIIFGVMLLWEIWLLKDSILIHYDNFSHWANIVKDMIITGHLPNFESKTILFKSYPPGTACFIYYVCKYCGSAESVMLIAQTTIILSSLYTIFAFCNKKISSYLVSISLIIFVLISNVFFIDQLLVDIVLSALGISALSVIFYYKDNVKKGLCLSIPILSFLTIVKNSGIFFVIIDLIIWFALFIKENGIKRIFTSKYILLILLPILVRIIFSGHVELVFGSEANTSLHAMSIENYIQTMDNKETSDYKTIFDKMIEEITNIKSVQNKTFLIMIGVFVIIIIIARKNKQLRNMLITLFTTSIASYIIYEVSMYFMYILSMPRGEALSIAAYSRYINTLVAFNLGICIIAILTFFNDLEISNKTKDYILKVLLCFLIILPIYYIRPNIRNLYTKPDNSKTSRVMILNYKKAYSIKEEKKYLIYATDEYILDNHYFQWMCRYDFRSPDVTLIKDFSELENIDQVFEYDYLIVLNKNDQIKSFLDQNGKDSKLDVFKLK